MCDPSPLIRDWTHAPAVEGWGLNHWTAREVSQEYFLRKTSAQSLFCSSAFMMSYKHCNFVFLCFKENKGSSINITEFLQLRYLPEKLSFNDWLLTSPYQKPGLYGCSEGQRNVLTICSSGFYELGLHIKLDSISLWFSVVYLGLIEGPY